MNRDDRAARIRGALRWGWLVTWLSCWWVALPAGAASVTPSGEPVTTELLRAALNPTAVDASPEKALTPSFPSEESLSDRVAPAAATTPTVDESSESPANLPKTGEELAGQLLSPERLSQSIPTVLVISLLGLGPLLVLLTTGFIRISIVLALLRQAFGTAQIPSNQVLSALSILLTVLLMTPVWSEVYREVVEPRMQSGTQMTWSESVARAKEPVQRFMIAQMKHTDSSQEVWLFWKHAGQSQEMPEYFEEVPFRVLLPAFVLSELKTAFLIGLQIYLPFLVIDLLASTLTMATGLSSFPSQSIALPLKLMLFVLVDGWQMVVDLLLRSFMG